MTATQLSTSYTLPQNYQSLSASEKRNLLWNHITAPENVYDPRLGVPSSSLSLKNGINTLRRLALTFDHAHDVYPEGRERLIHRAPSPVAMVELIPSCDSESTGLLQGASGLIRLSSASSGGQTFGLGLKLFVDGQPSRNIVAMYSLAGQAPNTNFFQHNFKTRVEIPKWSIGNLINNPLSLIALKTGGFIFSLAQVDPGHIAIDHLGTITRGGQIVANPSTPDHLVLIPAIDVSEKIPPDSKNNLGVDITRNIKKGATLYYVHASSGKYIGHLKLTSDFVTSSWADKHLFFQHHRTRLGLFDHLRGKLTG